MAVVPFESEHTGVEPACRGKARRPGSLVWPIASPTGCGGNRAPPATGEARLHPQCGICRRKRRVPPAFANGRRSATRTGSASSGRSTDRYEVANLQLSSAEHRMGAMQVSAGLPNLRPRLECAPNTPNCRPRPWRVYSPFLKRALPGVARLLRLPVPICGRQTS